MSVRSAGASWDDVDNFYRLVDLIDALEVQRNEIIAFHARRFRVWAISIFIVFSCLCSILLWVMGPVVSFFFAREWRGLVPPAFGLFVFLMNINVWPELSNVSRGLALRFSKSLRAELASIDKDRARLIGLVNEARITLADQMTEFQRIELDIRLRRVLTP